MVDVLTGNMYYYGNDKLGTPQIITDSTNTVVWEADYKPFGEADVNPNSTVVNIFRFPGQYYDTETGLHYNYHRHYDPRTGRYLTPDPIGVEGGINLFTYVSNNPINKTDPEGLYPGPCGNKDHTWVPDYPLGFDFTWPCKAHDDCYGCKGARKSKWKCDYEFLRNMTMTCFRYPGNIDKCMSMAFAYFIAVSRGADDAFTDARECCAD